MGRELKRVPIDFDYPLNKVWYGYFINYITPCYSGDDDKYCESCRCMAKIKGVPITDYNCPDFDAYFGTVIKQLKKMCEPPEGDGFQLWETTSEGSPVSPVFETLDALCEWCEDHAKTFRNFKASKEEWKQMLDANPVYEK